jgi:hypothetical protein
MGHDIHTLLGPNSTAPESDFALYTLQPSSHQSSKTKMASLMLKQQNHQQWLMPRIHFHCEDVLSDLQTN